MGHVEALPLILSFLVLWAGVALVLSRLAQPLPRRSLTDRLAPYVQREEQVWTDEVEDWLRSRGRR
jgi:hypothetical protein